jgi:glycosyltransferase involved in cell wall biosynthesis
MSGSPSIGVVVPTHHRPQQLRQAVDAIIAQNYPGPLRIAVVYERGERPDPGLAQIAPVQVLVNRRTTGLAGAKNTGVLALATDLIAFCDDDDCWLPGKLCAQVETLSQDPDAEMVSCGIVVVHRNRSVVRLAGRDEVTHEDLLRSRLMMVNSSTCLVRRAALLDGIGLVDETIPHGYAEDWDLALRASRRRPTAFVDRPLVQIHWSENSYYARRWEVQVAGLLWMLHRHPDIQRSRRGAGRVYGQLAFANACMARHRESWRWMGRALRSNWREPRVPVTLAVAARLVSGGRVLELLNSRGHGI